MISSRSCAAVVGRPLFGLLAAAVTGVFAQSNYGIGGSGLSVQDISSGLSIRDVAARRNNDSETGRAFYMIPTLGARAELTNNVNLSAEKKSDLILGIRPGIQIGGQSARVRGFLNYTLDANFYASDLNRATFYNNLFAEANVEAIENWMFIDASASISQQYINPFGTQSGDTSLNNDNQTQVTTLRVSPYVNGQIAGQVDYLGRLFYSGTNSGTSQASNSSVWGGLLSFGATTRWSRLSWGLTFSYREAAFEDTRTEFDQLSIASLTYAITPDLKFTVRGNVETSNLVSVDSETNTGWGLGLRWNPSPRTNLALEYDQRVFGSSHLYSFFYFAPRSVWAISSVQRLSTGQFGTGVGATGGGGSTFDVLFAQFATIEPDPVARAQLVNAFIQANGLDPGNSGGTTFLPNQVTLETNNEASVALQGTRSTVIFSVFQTEAQALQSALLNPDNILSAGNVITWLGGGVNWAHRLTPRDSLVLNVRGRRTTESVGSEESTLWTGTATWSRQVAPRATMSLAARYQNLSSTTSPYNEAALLATLNMQF
jgi:uncharacterized protein (PEP-CTERM system associated)